MKRFPQQLADFGRQTEGNVAILVAFSVPVIAALTAGMIEFGTASSAERRLQDSLDAAALAVARSHAETASDVQSIGMNALKANLVLSHGATLNENATKFTLVEDGRKVTATAQMSLNTSVLGGTNAKVDIKAGADALRPANLEVSLVLAVTGSMPTGPKLADRNVASNDLVDIVVQDQQEPFYSKVALVPYSMAVNVGALASDVRGDIVPVRTVTGVAGNRDNKVVFTVPNHGFSNGQYVRIGDLNGLARRSSDYPHINNSVWQVTPVTSNTFTLNGADIRNYNSYQSGGTAACTDAGCEWYRFRNAEGNTVVHRVSTCVTERNGGNAYTDVQPSLAQFGRNYPSAGCLQNTIEPLSSDKTSLKSDIDALQAVGSTGGHIGVGWGWYMVSPRFGYLFPSASRGAAYDKTNLIKAVVIMTDGEYNSAYCNGVISKDSTNGSGGANTHIDCNAPNGHSFTQAMSQCTAMKAAGVKVYTVGFAVVNDQRARDLVNNCASSPAHVHLPATGTELKTAFRLIGQELAGLRIAH